ECKWSNLHYKKAESILKSLKDKGRLVQWRNNDRSEIYGLIAKKIEGKEKIIQQGFLVLDLEDILK
ncbi:MAG: ATP-binding protein, partial [Promethearchaeota archaeon]